MEWGKKKDGGVEGIKVGMREEKREEGIKDGMREEKKKKKKEWEKKKRGVCEVENQSDGNSPPRPESWS